MPQTPDSSAVSRSNRPNAALLPAAQFDSPGQCLLEINGTTEIGPNAGETFQGTLSISIGSDGAIDAGTLQLVDGTSVPVVGQATGRSIRLRIGTTPDDVMTFTGSGVSPIDACTGDFTGAFAGPGLRNIGVWLATAQSAS